MQEEIVPTKRPEMERVLRCKTEVVPGCYLYHNRKMESSYYNCIDGRE